MDTPEPKPDLSLVPAKADQIAALYKNLTGKEMTEDGRKSLADKLREQGWAVNEKQKMRDTLAELGIPVVKGNDGGIVITGVNPDAP